MNYQNIFKAKFINRPNRFIANVDLFGNIETVHVKNTGRCKELLVPGATVFLSYEDRKMRKTKYDLVAVEKKLKNNKTILINMDSQAPNQVAEEFFKSTNFFSSTAIIKREVTFENSRFDFMILDDDKRHYIEVKGVTLEEDGVARFPDAPTERGVKHLEELILAKEQGHDASILFVIQFKGARVFSPNNKTDPKFASTLRKAAEIGVNVFAYDCNVSDSGLQISEPVEIIL